MASDSIELEPVKAKAMNLLAAMPRFANSAANTTRMPPSVLMFPLS
jgi:hypothetical protein